MIAVSCDNCGKDFEADHLEECTYGGKDVLCRNCANEEEQK